VIAHVITPADFASYRRCRRQWDLGATLRRDLEPVAPTPVAEVGRALRAALAVYYFPGMWDWDRGIVLPLAVKAFTDSMHTQRAALAQHGSVPPHRQRGWERDLEEGRDLLKRYFDWAPGVDRFSPIRVETDFEVNVPDPRHPGEGLVAEDGVVVRYGGTVQLLVMDERDAYWIVEHRLVEGNWHAVEDLVLDRGAASFCWALPLFFIDIPVGGTMYNELRRAPVRSGASAPPAPPKGPGVALRQHGTYPRADVRAARAPDKRIDRVGNDLFRRTTITRKHVEVERLRAEMSAQAAEMVDPDIAVYPSPAREKCAVCPFVEPCVAVTEGSDADAILQASFRRRPRRVESGRLGGSTWGVGRGAAPPSFSR
jgi:hypothetical protein